MRSLSSQASTWRHTANGQKFFIDAKDHLGEGTVVWDKRKYLDAKDGGLPILVGCITQLDEQATITPRFNVQRFVARMEASGNPDYYARQQIM